MPAPAATPAARAADRSDRGMSRGAFWLMLRRVAVFAACVDVIYLITFFVLGMPVMALVNLISFSMYAAAYVLIGKRHNLPAILLMWLEVLGHAGSCTILLGWNSGVHYFLLVFLPAVAFSRSPKHAMGAMGFILMLYLLLDYATQVIPVVYPLAPNELTLLRWLSISVVFVMFGYTARYYTGRVQEAENQLYALATTDPLSGLWNRRHFLESAHTEVERARRHETPVALVLVDIDHFKHVNDEHGHDVGDRVIQHVARMMREQLRASDLLGRWGGEEFVLLLPVTDADAARALGERLRVSIEQAPCVVGELPIAVTVSLGVCEVDQRQSLDHAFKAADAALYQAKYSGRNRVCLVPPPRGDAAPAPVASETSA